MLQHILVERRFATKNPYSFVGQPQKWQFADQSWYERQLLEFYFEQYQQYVQSQRQRYKRQQRQQQSQQRPIYPLYTR